jgi:S-adenosylmethionine decarboxylase proenzyme
MKSKSAMKHNKKNVTHSDNGVTSEDKHHYTIEVSKKTLIFTLVISALVSFIAGRSAKPSDFISFHADSNQDVVPSKGPQEHPSLMLHAHKEPPQHRYSGMEFNASASNGRVVNTHLPSSLSDGEKVCTVAADGDKQCVIDNTNSDAITDGKIQVKENEDIDETDGECSSGEECDDDDKDEHLPAGQHLLIDIKNVDSEFLNSDVRLAKAMVDVVNLSQLTLLSYHCHNLIPQGVSCVGVLLESHISFHTWPEAGVITLDLFTCGSGKLVPVIPFVESLFAVQQIGSLVKPFVRWVHKLRGFRPEGNDDVLSKDLGRMLEETFDVKKEVCFIFLLQNFFTATISIV